MLDHELENNFIIISYKKIIDLLKNKKLGKETEFLKWEKQWDGYHHHNKHNKL